MAETPENLKESYQDWPKKGKKNIRVDYLDYT